MIPNQSTKQDSNLHATPMPSYAEMQRLIAKGNHLRAEVLSAGLRAAVSALVALPGRLRASLAERLATARAVQHLSQMDDRLLADIGLTRGDIGHAVLFGRDRPDRGVAVRVKPVEQFHDTAPANAVNDSHDRRQVA